MSHDHHHHGHHHHGHKGCPAMKKAETKCPVDEADLAHLKAIREKFNLSSDAAAVKMALALGAHVAAAHPDVPVAKNDNCGDACHGEKKPAPKCSHGGGCH